MTDVEIKASHKGQTSDEVRARQILAALKRKAIIQVGLSLSPLVDRALAKWSLLADQPVYDSSQFGWVSKLEENWLAIKAEAKNVLGDRSAMPPVRVISPDHSMIATDEGWKSYVMWGYGLRSEINCARCPETATMLDGIPGLLSAMFSVLDPHSHIPRHVGPTKAIVTAHLGLQIPRQPERCRIQVADVDYVWEEGGMILFDDMYPHEVWNDTDERRVVLLLHIERPERFPGSLIRDAFIAAARNSPFIQDVSDNIEAWRELAE